MTPRFLTQATWMNQGWWVKGYFETEDSRVYVYAHGTDSLKGTKGCCRREGITCRNKFLQETRVESKAQVEDFAFHRKEAQFFPEI